MLEIIAGMKIDAEMLRTAFGNSISVGPIAVVDAKKGYRIKIADGDEGPVLSNWYPHPESGGQTSTWMPLSVGQVVGVLHPHGDRRQGFMIRDGFSGKNGQPSEDLAANVLKAFGITITMKDGKVTLEGDLLVKGNVDFKDGHVKSNDKHIDDTHVHGGIVPGNANTDVPAY